MESDWAAQNLQTIRTLMERASTYRRALAPIMITVGCIGLAASLLGWTLKINAVQSFILYWLIVAFIACVVAFVLVRRQAIQAREAVWSPPARRVVQAAAPALTIGFITGVGLLLLLPRMLPDPKGLDKVIGTIWLPLAWVMLYGCAMHAAGFFLPRGMKILGWIFIFGGGLLFLGGVPKLPDGMYAHAVMGIFFGLLQQAYGVYLYMTEQKDVTT